jgi:hypothetical protein
MLLGQKSWQGGRKPTYLTSVFSLQTSHSIVPSGGDKTDVCRENTDVTWVGFHPLVLGIPRQTVSDPIFLNLPGLGTNLGPFSFTFIFTHSTAEPERLPYKPVPTPEALTKYVCWCPPP